MKLTTAFKDVQGVKIQDGTSQGMEEVTLVAVRVTPQPRCQKRVLMFSLE